MENENRSHGVTVDGPTVWTAHLGAQSAGVSTSYHSLAAVIASEHRISFTLSSSQRSRKHHLVFFFLRRLIIFKGMPYIVFFYFKLLSHFSLTTKIEFTIEPPFPNIRNLVGFIPERVLYHRGNGEPDRASSSSTTFEPAW